MTLKEQIDEIIFDADIAAAPDRISELVQETSTDFLLWYIEEKVTPETDPRSIYDLWREFSVEKQL